MTKRILIVGCGATGLATFSSIVDKLCDKNFNDVVIDVIERDGKFGEGLAYSTGVDDHLLNMRVSTMSIKPDDPEHFHRWVTARGISDEYVPRKLFGEYLREYLQQQRAKAESAGIQCNFYHDEITSLKEAEDKAIVSSRQFDAREYDTCIVCVGNQPPTNHVALRGKPGYINDFWREGVDKIPPDEEVAILGTSLSAIDCYFSLRQSGHKGKISMVSRHGLLPKARFTCTPYTLQILTRENLNRIVAEKGRKLELDEITALFQEEFAKGGADTDMFQSAAQLTQRSSTETLREDIAAARDHSQAFSILKAIDDNAGYVWSAMTDEAKKEFDEKYKTLWFMYDYPMPSVTAEKILKEMESGRLGVIRGLTNVTFNDAAGHFDVEVSPYVKQEDAVSGSRSFRHVINATGMSVDVSKMQDPLLQDGIASGLFTVHPFGGVNVDFDHGNVIMQNGPSRCVYLAGTLTRGVHFYVNSLEQNAKAAEKIAEACVGQIVGESKGGFVSNINVDKFRGTGEFRG